MPLSSAPRGYLSGVTIGNSDVDALAISNAKIANSTLRGAKLNKRCGQLDFLHEAVSSKRLGGATTGATGDRNQFLFEDGLIENHVKGTQTILTPVLTAVGWDIGCDQTAADGNEFTPGILGRLDGPAFKVGTDAAFFTTLKFKPADASGANPILVGFRKAEAYQAAVTSYADYALIGIVGTSNPNLIKIKTQQTGGGNTDTDTTDTWADNAVKTLGVYVSAGGVVTFTTDANASGVPTAVVAYTFTAALTVIPCVYFLQAADLCDTLELVQWKWGFQADT